MGKHKATKRSIQAMETKARIFETASELLARKGFDNVTIVDICKKAGVSTGAFYNYFKSKDDIVLEQFRKVEESYSQIFAELDPQTPVLDRVEEFAAKVLEHESEGMGKAGMQIIYRGQLSAKRRKTFISPSNGVLYKILTALFQEGVERGEIDPELAPRALAHIAVTCIRGAIFEWSSNYTKADLTELAGQVTGLLIRGMRPQTAQAILMSELAKGEKSGEEKGWLSHESVKAHFKEK